MNIISPAPDTDNTPPCHVFEWCEEPEHESPLFGWFPALDGTPFRDHSVSVSPAASFVVHEAATLGGAVFFEAPKLRVHDAAADIEITDVEAAVHRSAALAASLILPDPWLVGTQAAASTAVEYAEVGA